ncbi:hypothetical protein [Candidatus Lokiarchaeum ossiferum]|uniref:hypothetical protein n=1 Tax=Candidatus Lokiarchaeum ossiferum TaxID=2951803 RepID=UPI00352DD7B2
MIFWRGVILIVSGGGVIFLFLISVHFLKLYKEWKFKYYILYFWGILFFAITSATRLIGIFLISSDIPYFHEFLMIAHLLMHIAILIIYLVELSTITSKFNFRYTVYPIFFGMKFIILLFPQFSYPAHIESLHINYLVPVDPNLFFFDILLFLPIMELMIKFIQKAREQYLNDSQGINFRNFFLVILVYVICYLVSFISTEVWKYFLIEFGCLVLYFGMWIIIRNDSTFFLLSRAQVSQILITEKKPTGIPIGQIRFDGKKENANMLSSILQTIPHLLKAPLELTLGTVKAEFSLIRFGSTWIIIEFYQDYFGFLFIDRDDEVAYHSLHRILTTTIESWEKALLDDRSPNEPFGAEKMREILSKIDFNLPIIRRKKE